MTENSERIYELVLPCYNEGPSLEKIVKRAIEAAKAYAMTAKDFRLILVENGSRDQSLAIMKNLKADPECAEWFAIVEVPQNKGYGHGVWQGLMCTTAPYVSWSHSDQQCDPMDAFKALHVLRNSERSGTSLEPLPYLIKGRRFGRSLQEQLVSRVFEILALLILGKFIYEINAQPKVFSRRLLDLIKNPPKDFSFDLYVLYVALKNNYKLKTIDVSFPPRVHGLSNWAHTLASRRKTIWNMILYMFELRKENVLRVRSAQVQQ